MRSFVPPACTPGVFLRSVAAVLPVRWWVVVVEDGCRRGRCAHPVAGAQGSGRRLEPAPRHACQPAPLPDAQRDRSASMSKLKDLQREERGAVRGLGDVLVHGNRRRSAPRAFAPSARAPPTARPSRSSLCNVMLSGHCPQQSQTCKGDKESTSLSEGSRRVEDRRGVRGWHRIGRARAHEAAAHQASTWLCAFKRSEQPGHLA